MGHGEELHKKTEERVKDCVNLEMRYDGSSFFGREPYNKDFNIHHTDMMCMDDEKWKKTIAEMAAELERRKENAERIYDVIVDADDDVMTVKDWLNAVDDGCFSNNDGCGYWVKDGLACGDEVFSSAPLDATHVVWYNK